MLKIKTKNLLRIVTGNPFHFYVIYFKNIINENLENIEKEKLKKNLLLFFYDNYTY